MNKIKKVMEFAKQHIILSNFSHAFGGFGLALVLQGYIIGNAFLPITVGWILLGFSVAVHIYGLVS